MAATASISTFMRGLINALTSITELAGPSLGNRRARTAVICGRSANEDQHLDQIAQTTARALQDCLDIGKHLFSLRAGITVTDKIAVHVNRNLPSDE